MLKRSVTVLAPAKLNLSLDVVGTLPNGYHDLDMLMQSVTLCDQMTMEEAPQLSLYVRAQGRAFVPADGNNLVLKAAAALQAATGCTRGARITLKKYIPVAAGMGGGSSDAAAALRALRTLYAPDISDGRLETLAARLGSDVPFFIRGGTQLATGRGEVVSPLPPLTAGWFVVVKPDEGYSTAEMYRRLDEPGSVLVRNSRYMQDAVAANNVHAVAVELHNSFERVVPKDSSLRTIKDALRAQGALGTLLSGSGSAVFGLFDDQSAAAAAAEALKKTWPWVFVARPV